MTAKGVQGAGRGPPGADATVYSEWLRSAALPRAVWADRIHFWVRSLRSERLPVALARVGVFALSANPVAGALRRHRICIFEGRAYQYLAPSVQTERRIEIPLALDFLSSAPPDARILEVGNSLWQYAAIPRVIVDRYEVRPGVLNEDIVEYAPRQRFTHVVSISTLEHVGFDEPTPTRGKFVAALEALVTRCASPGAQLLVTVPVGYNPEVDELLLGPEVPPWRRTFLARTSVFNEWSQLARYRVSGVVARKRYPGTNVVGVLRAAL